MNDRMVAINSAIEVDLTGQVCAESIGSQFYSGFGGQLDFIRGAARSKYGKPIIALPSTAKNDTISRIVPRLAHGRGRADRTRRRALCRYRIRHRLSARPHHPATCRGAHPDRPSQVSRRALSSTANSNAGFNATLTKWKCEGKKPCHRNRAVTSSSILKNAKDAACVWSRVLQNVLNWRLSSTSTVCIRRNIPARIAPAAAPVSTAAPSREPSSWSALTPPRENGRSAVPPKAGGGPCGSCVKVMSPS